MSASPNESPDGLPDEFKALLNQVPPTMQATRDVLFGMGTSVEASKKDAAQVFENLRPLLVGLASGILSLDNKLEQLDGRPGIAWGNIDTLLSEFGRN